MVRFISITRESPAKEKAGDGSVARKAAFSVLTAVRSRYDSATIVNGSLSTVNRYGDVAAHC